MSEDTIFHKIMRKEIPAEMVYEDELAFAIRDIQPAGPTHLLVIPKKTLADIRATSVEDKELLGHLLVIASQLAQDEGISESGYRVVLNAGNDGGQSVDQLHVHVIGGRPLNWPPG